MMKRSISRPSPLLLLVLALLLAIVGGSRAAAQVTGNSTRASCPLICSTPEIYGFTQGGVGLCQCAAALPGGAYYLRGADNCFCYMCFAPQPDGTVLGYFYKDDGTCMEGSVDCTTCIDRSNWPVPSSEGTELSSTTSSRSTSSSKNSTAVTSQPPTAAPAVSSPTSPPPASASSSSTTSTSKSGGWSGIATGVLTFLCVLVLGMVMVMATSVYRKNARTRLNRYGGGGDDIFYRAQGSSSGGSVYFEAPAATAVAPVTIAVRSHVIGETPAETYEVLVFGVDSSNEYEQQQQQLAERQL